MGIIANLIEYIFFLWFYFISKYCKWLHTVCVYYKNCTSIWVHGFNVCLWLSPFLCCSNSLAGGGGWPAGSSSRGSVAHAIARKRRWFWLPTCVSVGASRNCECDSTSSRPGCTQQPPGGHPHPCIAARAASSAPAPPLGSQEQRGGTHACPSVACRAAPGPQVDRHTPMREARRIGTAAAPAATAPLAKCSNLESSAP